MNLTELSAAQYELVVNVLNLTVALMGATSVLLVLLRERIDTPYRLSLSLMTAATAMACYHYLRLLESWRGAYALEGGRFVPTGLPYSETFRYADWLGTVPLILAALMLVLDIGRHKSRALVSRLVGAALAMLLLGYLGETQGDAGMRALLGVLGTLPFVYILYVLWGELASVLRFETPQVQERFGTLRWLLLGSWSLHPLVYALPLLGLNATDALIAAQVGHALADLSAKAVFGMMLYTLAYEKTLDRPVLSALPASSTSGMAPASD